MKRFAFVIPLLMSACGVSASTLRVPSEYTTIQPALDVAAPGDTVLVADGVYTGAGNRDLEFGGKSIVLLSENGPENTIIDCGGTSNEPHRAVRFHDGEDSATVLSGFTIRNGFAPLDGPNSRSVGGAVFCDSASSPLIANCILARDSAWDGGGVYCYYSSPTFRDCRIEGNYGINLCGGAYSSQSSPNFIDCAIVNNAGYSCGGFYGLNSNITISGCLIRGNSGINGGGLLVESGTASLSHTDLIGNQATRGGAVYGGTVEAEFCLFRDNEALERGSCFYESDATLTNCTLFRNTAPEGVVYYSDLVLDRCIVAFNQSLRAFITKIPVMTCVDIYGQGKDDTLGIHAAQLGVNGNITADPQFCDTASNDLHLWYLSPCGLDSVNCGFMGVEGVGCDDRVPPLAGHITYGDSDPSYPAVRTADPLIAWHYTDTIPGNQMQYWIQVGTDSDWSVAELWDTGPVQSGDTAVLYGGAPFQDHQSCYVRIRVAGDSGWGSWIESYFLVRFPPQTMGPSDWPTFQYNNQHTGYNDRDQITVPLQLKWKRKVVDRGANQLTVVGDRIYWTTAFRWDISFWIYCLDATTGDSLWADYSYIASALVQPTYADGRLFYQVEHDTRFSRARACDPETGSIFWDSAFYDTGNEMLAPIVANGKVVIASSRTSLHGFDVIDGGNRWFHMGGLSDNGTTAEFHDTVYVCGSPMVTALDLMTGEQLWQVGYPEAEGPDNCAPVIDTLTRMLYHYRFLKGLSLAFDLDNREVVYFGALPHDTIGVWELGMGVMSRAPVLKDGILYLVERGNLSALNPMTGDSLWSIAGYRFHYTPVGANGLIFASNDTLTCAIDIYARKVVWSIDIGGELSIANNSLYIATVDGWVCVYGDVLTDVGDDNRPLELPNDYRLLQNYPNPFNPSTTIEYRLPVRSEVELSIYNILGQRVKTLVSGPQSAGDHTVVWNATSDSGRRVATGIYFYRLKTPGFVQTKKMLLMK